jgi:hypothetical protein
MADHKPDNEPSELPTPRSNPHEDGSGGDTEVPGNEPGISNRGGDRDEDRQDEDERRSKK